MQPFFIELYNLNPSGQIPPSPEEKQKLTKLIRVSHERYSLFISAHQSLPIIYYPQRNFAFDWRDDWWEKDYPAFLEEYSNLRRFIDDYLAGRFSAESQTWFRQMLQLLRTELDCSFQDNKIQFSLIGSMASTGGFSTQITKETKNILGLTYWEIIDLLRGGKTVNRCQAPKTQKTPACQNIFVPSTVGKKQRFCSIRCANRVRRLDYYQKTGK
jgi:hypothetical protein